MTKTPRKMKMPSKTLDPRSPEAIATRRNLLYGHKGELLTAIDSTASDMVMLILDLHDEHGNEVSERLEYSPADAGGGFMPVGGSVVLFTARKSFVRSVFADSPFEAVATWLDSRAPSGCRPVIVVAAGGVMTVFVGAKDAIIGMTAN